MKRVYCILSFFIFCSMIFLSGSIISIGHSHYSTRAVPGFILGPSSFAVNNDTFYVCNPINGNLMKKTKTGLKILRSKTSPQYIFFENGDRIEVYNDFIEYDGKEIPINELEGSIKFISAFGGRIYVSMAREITYILNDKGNIIGKHDGLFHNGTYFKSILHNSGFRLVTGKKKLNIRLPFKPASASIEGISDNLIAVIIDKFISQSPIKVSQYLYILNYNGDILYNIVLPNIHYFYFPRPIRIYNDTVYYAVPNKNSLDIINVYPGNGMPDRYYQSKFHYNSTIPQEKEFVRSMGTRVDTPITRTEVINVADSYVNHTFYASSSNITDGIVVDPNGDTVRTPSWVTVGNHSSVPYKWGGFSSLSQFDDGLTNNRYAGDNYTGNNVSAYAVGVDCSGFVSRCWGTSSKYGTSTIPNISTALSSLNDLRRGDCLNYAGHHVRLAAEDNPDGTVYICEASGVDWKVSYRTYDFTDLTNYEPRRYDNIVDDTVYYNNFVVKVVNCSNLNLREGPGTNYNVISTLPAGNSYVATDYNSSGWYKLIIPSGTGYSYGWSYGGTDLSGYLTGNARNPVFKVKSFKGTLNVRSGPTTDSSVITTITSGQEFAVLDSSGHWYKIGIPAINGYTYGWCSAGASGTYGTVETLSPVSPYGATITNPVYGNTLESGENETVTLTVKNTGSIPFDGFTYLAVTNSRNHKSLLRDSSWIDSTNIKIMPSLLPGQSDTISFLVTNNCLYDSTLNEYFTLKEVGYKWFSDSTELGPSDTDFYITLNLFTSGIVISNKVNSSSKLEINGICKNRLFVNYMNPISKTTNFTIYSLSGRKIQSGTLSNGINKISISGFSTGTYIFKAGKSDSRKFIILK